LHAAVATATMLSSRIVARGFKLKIWSIFQADALAAQKSILDTRPPGLYAGTH
jgi:hypothetical protein